MSPGSKLRWLWRAPARALGRVRDMYVRGLNGCTRYVPSDAAFGYPVFVPAPLSRSQSHSVVDDWGAGGSGADEDLRELVRAASQRRMEQRQAELRAVARSQSMAASLSMARIDEDAPSEFGAAAAGDDGPGALYPRSQSCVGDAAGRRTHRGHRKVVALVGRRSCNWQLAAARPSSEPMCVQSCQYSKSLDIFAVYRMCNHLPSFQRWIAQQFMHKQQFHLTRSLLASRVYE